jgi:phosphoribosylanthranilate isomerase
LRGGAGGFSIVAVTHRTRIKICGICRPEDGAAAARAGADAVGIVFHPTAPRNVPLDRAREILAALPAFVTPVGLFVNATPSALQETVRELHLRHIQLHGDESPEYVAGLRPFAVIKAIRVDPEQFGQTLARWREAIQALGLTNLKGIVLETAGTGHAGGTGIANDWRTVREHQANGGFTGLPPVIAAGGLTPETVGAVVRDVRPFAADVSSGVEESRGKKSPEKIAAFVAAVRRADEQA